MRRPFCPDKSFVKEYLYWVKKSIFCFQNDFFLLSHLHPYDFWWQKIYILVMDKIFVQYNLNFVLD